MEKEGPSISAVGTFTDVVRSERGVYIYIYICVLLYRNVDAVCFFTQCLASYTKLS